MNLTRRELLRLAGLGAVASATGCDLPVLRRAQAVPVDSWHQSVCRFCGSGCEMMVGLREGRVVKIEGDQRGWNRGRLCIKGLVNRDILYVRDRALHPMIRSGGRLVQASWDDALSAAADGFRRAIEGGGPEAVAFYGSGQLLTQESYVANKLFKGGIGTNNVDGNPRLCMASAAAGYSSVFGADEPLNCYDDIEHATLFFVIGANMAEAHPVVWERVLDRKRTRPDVRIIAVDPRRNRTTRAADQHLQVRPGTDVALLNAICHELIRTDLIDHTFIAEYLTFRQGAPDSPALGFEDLRAFLEDYAPEEVAELCGLGAAEIREVAQWIGTADAALSFWTMGLNQQTHGTGANRMVMAMHLLTGQVGRPGAGPFSLTGQPNAGGGVRDMGALSHSLPLGRVVANPQHRAEVERAWGVPAGRIAPRPGLHTVAMFQGMESGQVQAALVACTNPGQSLPNVDRYRAAMERGFLVVADAVFPTRTAELADVFFPAASWVEKEGVYSNSERRYHLIEKLVDPPGEARSDLEILLAFADRLGYGDLFPRRTPRELWDEWRSMSAGSKYDFSGMTYDRLRAEPGILWPCPSEDHPGACRRFVPGEDPLASGSGRVDFYARPDGRAIVFLTEQLPFHEAPDEEFPFILTTGRRLEHWHTMTMTGQVEETAPIPTDYLEIHPTDARRLGLSQGDPVDLISRRGSVRLWAWPTDNVRPGLVFATFHSARHLVNATTIDQVDPISFEPEFKLCAVNVVPATAGVEAPPPGQIGDPLPPATSIPQEPPQ